MRKEHFEAIRGIKTALKFERLWNKETQEGLEYALEKLRTIATDAEEQDRKTVAISNLYKFHTNDSELTEEDRGYNAAIRDVLQIIDPERTRYEKD